MILGLFRAEGGLPSLAPDMLGIALQLPPDEIGFLLTRFPPQDASSQSKAHQGQPEHATSADFFSAVRVISGGKVAGASLSEAISLLESLQQVEPQSSVSKCLDIIVMTVGLPANRLVIAATSVPNLAQVMEAAENPIPLLLEAALTGVLHAGM